MEASVTTTFSKGLPGFFRILERCHPAGGLFATAGSDPKLVSRQQQTTLEAENSLELDDLENPLPE